MKTTTKFISVIMIFAFLLSTAGLFTNAFAADGKCGKNVTYSFDRNSGTLTVSGQGEMDDYIGDDFEDDEDGCSPWREWQDDIKSVVIENGVTNVGMFAFDHCKNLKSVKLSPSVVTIERNAFSDCVSLSDVTFSEGLKTIDGWAFLSCESLKSVKFPESVKEIGKLTFASCGLTEVVVPDSVTALGPETFAECEELIKFVFPKNMKEISRGITAGCSKLTEVVFPENVESLGRDLFSGCSSFESIKLPDTVKEIGFCTFTNCENLRKIEFSENVISIGEDMADGTALYKDESNWDNGGLYINNCLVNVKEDCKGTFTVKDGTRLIADRAFDSCTELTDIIIPASVKNIGIYPFCNCDALNSITFVGKDLSFDSECLIDEADGYTVVCYSGTPIADFAAKNNIKVAFLDGEPTSDGEVDHFAEKHPSGSVNGWIYIAAIAVVLVIIAVVIIIKKSKKSK